MTELELTIVEEADAKRVWDLGKDVAWEIQASNPHADKHGQADTWSFARGPLLKPSANKAPPSIVAGNSTLGRWRMAAADPERRAEAELVRVVRVADPRDGGVLDDLQPVRHGPQRPERRHRQVGVDAARGRQRERAGEVEEDRNDRGDPVVQLAPPLICTQTQFDEMEQILRATLIEGMKVL